MSPSPANQWTTGRGFLEAISEEANEVTEMLTLAVAIADQGARFDLEFGCTIVTTNTGEWLDTGTMSPQVKAMAEDAQRRYGNSLARALRYIDLRGQLLRNPAYPHLVRFAEPESIH